MKILHLGDLHLGKRVNEISMIEDQKFILDQIVTLVKEEKIDVILLCGDIYDKAIPTIEAIRKDCHLEETYLNDLIYILHHNLIRKSKRLRSRKMDTILIFICFHL